MTLLTQRVQDYLSTRRALGFKLEREGRLLEDFATYAAQAGIGTVTIDIAITWATLPVGASAVWAGQRLSAIRGFARYLHAFDPDAQIPPGDLLPTKTRRSVPYLYTDDDVTALMAAARTLRTR